MNLPFFPGTYAGYDDPRYKYNYNEQHEKKQVQEDPTQSVKKI